MGECCALKVQFRFLWRGEVAGRERLLGAGLISATVPGTPTASILSRSLIILFSKCVAILPRLRSDTYPPDASRALFVSRGVVAGVRARAPPCPSGGAAACAPRAWAARHGRCAPRWRLGSCS